VSQTAGDFASVHRGSEELIGELAVIETPTVVVPGNNETDEALRAACSSWPAACLLHDDAAERLAACPQGGVLVVHSRPKGHVDGRRHLGSESILRAVEDKQPLLVVCGHIHESAGEEASIGQTRVLNAGPAGIVIDV
jgi:uncharacterized protein